VRVWLKAARAFVGIMKSEDGGNAHRQRVETNKLGFTPALPCRAARKLAISVFHVSAGPQATLHSRVITSASVIRRELVE
jgi:hypothetical protein